MIVPLSVDVGLDRRPIGNWVLITATVAAFFMTSDRGFYDSDYDGLLLDGMGIGILTHVFLHADPLHLFGNMLFLWVFGNAVCARARSPQYLLCYVVLAVVPAVVHVMLDGGKARGASAAINGVAGMFLVLHPKDYITIGVVGTASGRDVPCWVAIAFWLTLDMLGLLSGATNVGHAAHMIGLATGILLAISLLKSDAIEPGTSPTLLDLNWPGRR